MCVCARERVAMKSFLWSDCWVDVKRLCALFWHIFNVLICIKKHLVTKSLRVECIGTRWELEQTNESHVANGTWEWLHNMHCFMKICWFFWLCADFVVSFSHEQQNFAPVCKFDICDELIHLCDSSVCVYVFVYASCATKQRGNLQYLPPQRF